MSEIRAKRWFSQSFLKDENVQRRIVAAGNYAAGDTVLEIGPGYGALTRHLLPLLNKLVAIEIDREACDYLDRRYKTASIDFINQDILETRLLNFGSNVRLIGNLPYHISTPILFHVTKQRYCVSDAIFMLQREVVDRIVASPGSKVFGKLSVSMQVNWSVEKIFDVPPEAFSPAPKVWSSVLRLIPHAKFSDINAGQLEKLLFTAFSKRRKSIRNALRGSVSESELVQCGIDPQSRPESISVEQYVELAKL
jgi:16S rRNA (adenine1518-N6/adenine1519-N6)-dimethyltransferase